MKWIKHKDGFRYKKEKGITTICCYCETLSIKESKIKNKRREFEKKEGGVSHGMCEICFKKLK